MYVGAYKVVDSFELFKLPDIRRAKRVPKRVRMMTVTIKLFIFKIIHREIMDNL